MGFFHARDRLLYLLPIPIAEAFRSHAGEGGNKPNRRVKEYLEAHPWHVGRRVNSGPTAMSEPWPGAGRRRFVQLQVPVEELGFFGAAATLQKSPKRPAEDADAPPAGTTLGEPRTMS